MKKLFLSLIIIILPFFVQSQITKRDMAQLKEKFDGKKFTFWSELDGPTKVIDIKNSSKQIRANVELYALDGNRRSQVFELKHSGDQDYFYVRNVNSNKFLDVYNGNKTAGTNIWQYVFNGGNAQKFRFVPKGRRYMIYSKLSNQLCVDVHNAKNENGSNIKLWHANGNKAQLFALEDMTEMVMVSVYNDVKDWTNYPIRLSIENSKGEIVDEISNVKDGDRKIFFLGDGRYTIYAMLEHKMEVWKEPRAQAELVVENEVVIPFELVLSLKLK